MAALPRWQNTIQDAEGNIQPLASIEVRVVATGLLASLWSDRAGATPITNPFNADSEGFAAFHVQAGLYNITATFGSETREWTYVAINDGPTDSENYREFEDAGDVTVLPTDTIVGINKAVGAATAVTLPAAADRNGVPVTIKDIKGDANSNPITPAFTGGELADGLSGASYQITTPYGWVTFYPRSGGYYVLASQL